MKKPFVGAVQNSCKHRSSSWRHKFVVLQILDYRRIEMYRSFVISRIYRKSYNSYCCKMCNFEFPLNINAVVYHLETTECHRQHFQSLHTDQELLNLPEELCYNLFDNGISYFGNSKYTCCVCNCTIFDLNTVVSHIAGYLHGKILDSKKFLAIQKVHMKRPPVKKVEFDSMGELLFQTNGESVGTKTNSEER